MLEVRLLTKRFAGRVAVDRVTSRMHPGEITG
jgi:ABC-type branched-subunit amino acid transport system ATPase component